MDHESEGTDWWHPETSDKFGHFFGVSSFATDIFVKFLISPILSKQRKLVIVGVIVEVINMCGIHWHSGISILIFLFFFFFIVFSYTVLLVHNISTIVNIYSFLLLTRFAQNSTASSIEKDYTAFLFLFKKETLYSTAYILVTTVLKYVHVEILKCML